MVVKGIIPYLFLLLQLGFLLPHPSIQNPVPLFDSDLYILDVVYKDIQYGNLHDLFSAVHLINHLSIGYKPQNSFLFKYIIKNGKIYPLLEKTIEKLKILEEIKTTEMYLGNSVVHIKQLKEELETRAGLLKQKADFLTQELNKTIFEYEKLKTTLEDTRNKSCEAEVKFKEEFLIFIHELTVSLQKLKLQIDLSTIVSEYEKIKSNPAYSGQDNEELDILANMDGLIKSLQGLSIPQPPTSEEVALWNHMNYYREKLPFIFDIIELGK